MWRRAVRYAHWAIWADLWRSGQERRKLICLTVAPGPLKSMPQSISVFFLLKDAIYQVGSLHYMLVCFLVYEHQLHLVDRLDNLWTTSWQTRLTIFAVNGPCWLILLQFQGRRCQGDSSMQPSEIKIWLPRSHILQRFPIWTIASSVRNASWGAGGQ